MMFLPRREEGLRSGNLKACGWSSGNAATAKMPSRFNMKAGRAGSVGENGRDGWVQQRSFGMVAVY